MNIQRFVYRVLFAAFDDVSFQSRESWAAIHQGTVPPVYEDTDFHEWQKWHRSLDKMEMKKRKRRTIEFIEESDRQATIFVYEMQARRALELYVRLLFPQFVTTMTTNTMALFQEDRLTDEELCDVLMWIEYTSEQRQVRLFRWSVILIIILNQ